MKPSNLTSSQFQTWRLKRGMSIMACAKRLGISASSINLYEAGQREERPVIIPLLVTLGMAAINNNLKPYDGELNDSNTGDTGSSAPSGIAGISNEPSE